MPHDETPTPTKMLAKAAMEGLFEQMGNQNGETAKPAPTEQPPKVDNPFDRQFKESITPDPVERSSVEPNAEKDVAEIPPDINDESMANNPAANVGREVTVNSDTPSSQSEPGQKSPKPQFKVG